MSSWYQGRDIAVIGYSGFIGQRLIKVLEDNGASVYPLSWESPNLDIEPFDILFYLGWQTDAEKANADPFDDLSYTAARFLSLLLWMSKYRPRTKVVFTGTATQVGFTYSTELMDETAKDEPITIYDIHKQLAEYYLRFFNYYHGLPTVSLRLTNVYGPGQISSRSFLNKIIVYALKGDPIFLYNPQQVRDYVYIDDVVHALLVAGSNYDVSGTHLIGSGIGTRFRELADLVVTRVSNCKSKVIEDPYHLQSLIDVRNFVADTTKFHRATGWVSQVSLREGIERTIAYYRDRL